LGESDDHPISFLLVVNKGEPLPENQIAESEQASRPEALSVREMPFKKETCEHSQQAWVALGSKRLESSQPEEQREEANVEGQR
jgi:hypothetical protein